MLNVVTTEPFLIISSVGIRTVRIIGFYYLVFSFLFSLQFTISFVETYL